MIRAKKLIKLARKWQKLASIKQKKLTLPRMSLVVDTNDCNTSSIIEKGHFVVYSADQKRFMLPLEYLKKEIVKEITLPRTKEDADTNTSSTSSVVEKGHFVVYSLDEKRFVLPLEYLKNEIIMELFKLAEEEFGLPGNGLLILPCDATFMEYVIALIKRKPSKDVEKALILSVASGRCSSSHIYQQETSQQLPIWSF
ncbi:hypothetical protein DITRI_Ditri01bG0030200 [Diplodiscus trichospermus]